MAHEEITINAVRNCYWNDSSNTNLICEVNFSHLPEEWVIFSCCSEETLLTLGTSANAEPYYVTEIFQNAVNGDYGTIEAYSEPEIAQTPLQTLLG